MADAVQFSDASAVALIAERDRVPSPLARTIPVPAPDRLAMVVWVPAAPIITWLARVVVDRLPNAAELSNAATALCPTATDRFPSARAPDPTAAADTPDASAVDPIAMDAAPAALAEVPMATAEVALAREPSPRAVEEAPEAFAR